MHKRRSTAPSVFTTTAAYFRLLEQWSLNWHVGPVPWKTVFPQTRWMGDSFRMIQVHYIYCALYFYYFCISSTSDHYPEVGDPGTREPLHLSEGNEVKNG